MAMLTRRQVIGSAVAAGGASLLTGRTGLAQPYEKGPRLEDSRVERIVGASHSRIEVVRELVEEDQGLANACWDWGGGDFESALGAAAHTGQREIALLLLDHGARLDIFAAAMLGMVDAVRAAIEAQPLARFTLGPHGIPLLRHAVAGGEGAAAVVAYLGSLRSADDGGERDFPLSKRELRWYVGVYGAGGAASDRFEARDNRLFWRDAVGEARPLRCLGNHEFIPVGATRPLLTFEFRQGHARLLRIDRGTAVDSLERID